MNTFTSRSVLSLTLLTGALLLGAQAALATAAPATTTPAGTMSDHSMTPATDAQSMDSKKAAMMAAHYQTYTRAAYDAARGTQRVLFFHATWCPNCKAANADIVKNLAQLPASVTIFKVDYDKEVALKKQYGITYQHTFVLVDGQGKALKKWAGGGLKEIVAQTRRQ